MRSYLLSLRRAEKHLSAADPKIARVIADTGRCALVPFWDRSPYESLVRAVAYQQLHANAAKAILGRMEAHFPGGEFPEPKRLANVKADAMRGFGFSAAKTTCILGIAAAAARGLVPTREAAEAMTDDELIDRLSELRGIGRWTVEMLLIFTLGRLDVMPVDDYGVKVGLQSLHGLTTLPKKGDFSQLTDHWRPYRSIGAWYLWREADRLKTVSKLKNTQPKETQPRPPRKRAN